MHLRSTDGRELRLGTDDDRQRLHLQWRGNPDERGPGLLPDGHLSSRGGVCRLRHGRDMSRGQRCVGHADAYRAQDALLFLIRPHGAVRVAGGPHAAATPIAASGCAASKEEGDHRGDVQQQSRELAATALASF